MKKSTVWLILCLSIASSIGSAFYFSKVFNTNQVSSNNQQVFPLAVPIYNKSERSTVPEFVEASKQTMASVVFIKTEAEVARRNSFWFFDFDPFGNIGKVHSTGSGVIISPDGYIVTNEHVVKNATKIEVVLNNGKKNYEAKVIGTAPSSDLALLKIEAVNLSPVDIANSDELEIGEWVLAVGNPFNLTSTVTAGIVSAKGRNINIVQNQFPIESFIQTDAAINPGNSGGALVNTSGKLVGINTAIASKTGSYVGYGFAIPSNIVVKIVNDLKEFGEIQRGFDGLEVVDINDEILEKVGEVQQGVYVARVSTLNTSTKDMFNQGDIIIGIEGKEVNRKADYDELLAYHRPGDRLKYTVLRNAKERTIDVQLVNMDGSLSLSKRETVFSEKLNAEFEKASRIELEHYGITHGIKVKRVGNGQLSKMNIPADFIFVRFNGEAATTIESLVSKLESMRGQIRIEGVSPQGGKQYLSFYAY